MAILFVVRCGDVRDTKIVSRTPYGLTACAGGPAGAVRAAASGKRRRLCVRSAASGERTHLDIGTAAPGKRTRCGIGAAAARKRTLRCHGMQCRAGTEVLKGQCAAPEGRRAVRSDFDDGGNVEMW